MALETQNRFYVYLHYRKDNGECFYVGKGTGRRYLNKYGRNTYWDNVANKYGWWAEKIQENLTEEEAFRLEAEYCEKMGYSNLTNLNKEFGNGGHSLPLESREKIREKKIGHSCYNDEWREKIKKGNTGKVVSEESREKMRKPKSEETKLKMKTPKGPQTPEVIEKRRKSLQGKSKPKGMMDKVHKNNQKPILQYDLKGNFIREWESMTLATKYLGKKGSGIANCARGEAKSAYGYLWKYK
jgi:hypothetical protein